MEVHILHKQGMTIRAISRQLGLSRNTVRKNLYAKDEKPTYHKSKAAVSKLDDYRNYIRKRLNDTLPIWLPATVIFQEIKALGYEGKVSKRLMKRLIPNSFQSRYSFVTDVPS